MNKIIHLIDRSRVVAREECPRLRFYSYDYSGTGLESDQQSLPLLSGIAIHSAHARLLAGQPLDAVVESVISDYVKAIEARGLLGLDVTKDIIKEQSALLEGMLRVWAITRMPMILEEYDVVSIEERWDWELAPGLVERMRMDVILRRKDDGLLFILDFKTVSYPSDIWFEKFEHDHQTCLYIQALKERMNEPVGGILYEGLVKGQFRKDTAKASPWYGQKIQQSPYTLAYKLDGQAGEHFYQTEYTNKKGYHKVKTFEEMSMKDWVNVWMIPGGNGMTPVNELIIAVPPISPPDYELLRMKDQVIREELEYFEKLGRYRDIQDDATAEAFLDIVAPMRVSRCFKYGIDNRCQFAQGICFNRGAEPLSPDSGYRRREPHHDTDMEMIA